MTMVNKVMEGKINKEERIPVMVTGKPINVEVEPSPLMNEAINILEELVKMCKNKIGDSRKPSKLEKINILGVNCKSKRLAVSPMLLSIDEDYEPLRNIAKSIHEVKELSPKLQAVVEKTYEVYLKHSDMGQVIFCDIGVPKNNEYSAYQEIKDGLIARGLSKDEIVFIHDYVYSSTKCKEVIDKFNNGIIKVLIGSTTMIGKDINIEKRLVALHHVDACWLPSEVIQREDKILRVGNLNKEVYIFRYLVKNSIDIFSWNEIERILNETPESDEHDSVESCEAL